MAVRDTTPGLRPALVVVVLSACAYLALGPLTGSTYTPAGLSSLTASLLTALVANALLAFAGWRAGAVTIPGAAAGCVIGIAIALGSGWTAWWLLVVMFAMVVLATHFGNAAKRAAGIGEPRDGRRGVGNAVANSGLAAGAACVFWATGSSFAQVAVVAALVTSGSDSIASEIGKARGGPTYQFPSLRRVPPGTTGGVSVAGTVAGAAAAALLAVGVTATGLLGPVMALGVGLSAVLAGFVEGLLAGPLEARGWNNDDVNVLNAGVGVLLAAGWSLTLN